MSIVVRDNTKGIKVNAGDVAQPFREEIQERIAKFRKDGVEPPLLVGLLANNDPAAKKYAEWTGRACRKDGIRYELREINDPSEVEGYLVDANNDPKVHGIIVYYPIFGQTESFSGTSIDDYLRDTVSFKCDVEGLCHTYRTNLYRNVRYLDDAGTQKCLVPCTALSVVKLLEACPDLFNRQLPVKRQLEASTVTILNRSEIVGRPLAAMLANDGATVYSIDINSIYKFENGRLDNVSDQETPESCVKQSNVVITGVPTKDYTLPSEWIVENTIVVNVASFKNVKEDELLNIPGVIYIPQVGKVTVAMLERNLLRLFEQFHQKQPRQQPWLSSNALQYYTAAAVTVLLALQLVKN